jgi:hypothetical protein
MYLHRKVLHGDVVPRGDPTLALSPDDGPQGPKVGKRTDATERSGGDPQRTLTEWTKNTSVGRCQVANRIVGKVGGSGIERMERAGGRVNDISHMLLHGY